MEPLKKLVVRVGSNKKAVSITRLVDVLAGLQETVFSIGDFLQTKKVRTGGNYPDSIRDTCELHIMNVRKGSVVVELQVPEPEQKTLAQVSTGEQALGVFSNMTKDIGTKKYVQMMENTVPDPLSRRRILERFRDVIPPNPNDFVEFSGDSEQKRQLKVEDRKKIEDILPKLESKDSKAFIGRLMELKASKQSNFQLDTADGIKRGKYSPKCLQFFKQNFNNLVKIKGVHKTSGLLMINENCLMEPMKNYPLAEFKLKGKPVLLHKPLQIDINFDDGENIFSEDTLGLLVVGKTFEECNKRLEEQISLLWKEYVEPDDTNFTSGAKELRKKLISMVK